MNKSLLLFAVVFAVSSCAQFTTNDQELAQLKQTADLKADAYIECVKQEARGYRASGKDISYVVDAAARKCQSDMEAYEESQADYLGAQYMVISGKMTESKNAVNARAETEVSELMLALDDQDAAPAPTGSAGKDAALASAAATATATVASQPGGWTSEQRVYIDCMEDQGRKYATLDESAPTIAEVAQSRCDDYMGGPNPALEKEGRAVVMGIVFDARVPQQRQRP